MKNDKTIFAYYLYVVRQNKKSGKKYWVHRIKFWANDNYDYPCQLQANDCRIEPLRIGWSLKYQT